MSVTRENRPLLVVLLLAESRVQDPEGQHGVQPFRPNLLGSIWLYTAKVGQDTKNRLNPLGRLIGASQEHLRNTSGAPQESCHFGFRGQSVYAACTSYGFGHACVEIHRELQNTDTLTLTRYIFFNSAVEGVLLKLFTMSPVTSWPEAA